METVKVPIFERTYTNIDATELNDLNQELIDGYLDESGGTVKRPGLSSLVDLGVSTPCGIDGLFWWEHQQCAIAVCKGNTFKLKWDGASMTATDLTDALLTSDKRVNFTTDGTYVLMANGGRIIYTDGNIVTTAMVDADAPDQTTHPVFLDGYIVANVAGSAVFNFSDVDSSLTWDGSFATVGGDADDITALLTFRRELHFLGPKSVEVWENDGTTPFSRLPGGMIQTGCIAPDSVVFTDNHFYWLNDKKVFVEYDGRTVTPLPSDFDKEIQNFETAYHCIGDRIEIDGKPFLIFSFPGEEVTLCYNYRGETWSKWGNYQEESAVYDRWKGNSYAFCPAWNLHLVGSKDSADVYAMSADYLNDNGEPIRPKRITGHVDFGTSKEKEMNQLRFRARRGEEDQATDPIMQLRWRKNNRSSWSNVHQLSLGSSGERDIIIRKHRLGVFRTIQFEFASEEAAPIVFSDAEADIEVLR